MAVSYTHLDVYKRQVLDNNVGYISLSTFSGNPSKEFKKAFLDLKKQGLSLIHIFTDC